MMIVGIGGGTLPMMYKVSYVVLGGKHPGAIRTQPEAPGIGHWIRLGRRTFEIVEVSEIMPPRDDFAFLHATLKLVEKSPENPTL